MSIRSPLAAALALTAIALCTTPALAYTVVQPSSPHAGAASPPSDPDEQAKRAFGGVGSEQRYDPSSHVGTLYMDRALSYPHSLSSALRSGKMHDPFSRAFPRYREVMPFGETDPFFSR